MAKVYTEIQNNIAIVDNALKDKNSVASWTDNTLRNLINTSTISLSEQEVKLISTTLKTSPAEGYKLLGKKMHIPVEGDNAFYNACKKANVPGLPKQEKSLISGKEYKNFLTNNVVGAVKKGSLQSADNTSFNALAISILATAQYKAELAKEAEPYHSKLESYQTQVEKIEKENNKTHKKTQLERHLGRLGVNFDEFKNCVKNVYLDTPDNKEGAKIGGEVGKIKLNQFANSALRGVMLVARQADSALVSNAVLERLLDDESMWDFTIDKLNDKETVNFLCRTGESREELLARIDKYSQEISAILPSRTEITSENLYDYRTLATTLIRGCIMEGVFGFETAEERFAALAKVSCDPKVTEILNNHPEFLPEELRGVNNVKDEEGNVISESNQVFLFDHEGQVVPVNAKWWPANNPPQWMVPGNTIPNVGKDVVDQIETRVTTDYATLPENQKETVPDNVSYSDLTNKDVKIGNGLTLLAVQKHSQQKLQRIEKENAVAKASLPNLCSDQAFYGLCCDLSYYKQCMQEAAKNFAKYGLYIKPLAQAEQSRDPAQNAGEEPAEPEIVISPVTPTPVVPAQETPGPAQEAPAQ